MVSDHFLKAFGDFCCECYRSFRQVMVVFLDSGMVIAEFRQGGIAD